MKLSLKKLIIRLCITAFSVVFIIFVYGLGGLAGQFQPERVERSSAFAMKVFFFLAPGSAPCPEGDRTQCGYTDTSDRVEVSCEAFAQASSRQAVIFAIGQSNSANYGESIYIPLNKSIVNFNPHDGKCYKAEDPLLGPDGNRGSVWLHMADQLIQDGHYDSVLVSSFGIGGTEIARWTPGGDLHVRIQHAAKQLLDNNIQPTHVVWHQGEADAVFGTSEADYKTMFSAMVDALREYGIDAPVYPAVATHCGDIEGDIIRQAQSSLPKEIAGVFAGPNTDTLTDKVYRYDNCHFSIKGLKAHAQLWVDALTATPQTPLNLSQH